MFVITVTDLEQIGPKFAQDAWPARVAQGARERVLLDPTDLAQLLQKRIRSKVLVDEGARGLPQHLLGQPPDHKVYEGFLADCSSRERRVSEHALHVPAIRFRRHNTTTAIRILILIIISLAILLQQQLKKMD